MSLARRKEEKWLQEQHQRLDGWQQYRALWDGIDFKRQLLNMGDKKVRFALVIKGALNAMLLIVLTSGPVLRSLSPALRPWLAVLLAGYGVGTFGFVLQAIGALRLKPAARLADQQHWEARERREFHGSTPTGLMIHGATIETTFEDDRRQWATARLSDVTAELVLFNRSSSFMLTEQIKGLQRVYVGLTVLTVIAALILTLVVGTTVLVGGAPR